MDLDLDYWIRNREVFNNVSALGFVYAGTMSYRFADCSVFSGLS